MQRGRSIQETFGRLKAPSFALALLAACASSDPPKAQFAPDFDWLFSEETFDELPLPVDQLSGAQLEHVDALPWPKLEAFSSAAPAQKNEARGRLVGRLVHASSGLVVDVEIGRERFPGSVGALREVLSLMRGDNNSIDDHHALRVSFVGQEGAYSTAKLDGKKIDGLAWWAPSGHAIFVRVEGAEGRHEALIEDIRRLLSAVELGELGEPQ